MNEHKLEEIMSMDEKKAHCYQELDELLQNSHISVTDGYHYAGESMGIFHWMLRIFAESYSEKHRELSEAYQQFINKGEDKEGYTVVVHSLKSNARSIGANQLSEMCYEHEQKSRDGQINYVKEYWAELQKEWLTVVNGIWEYFGEEPTDITS